MPVNLPIKTRKTVKEPVKASVNLSRKLLFRPVKNSSRGVHENEVLRLAKYINALGTGKTTAQNHVILQGTTEPHHNRPVGFCTIS